MSKLSDNPSLKEIDAYKKKLNWGDVPTIYQLATNSIREMDGLLTHGFNNAFKHNINEQHYELHCYPIINNEPVKEAQFNNPQCPFIEWTPLTMQTLFRLNSLLPFIVYTFQKGDLADYALIRYANQRVDELITVLSQSFDITDIKGYSIAECCKEVYRKQSQSQS